MKRINGVVRSTVGIGEDEPSEKEDLIMSLDFIDETKETDSETSVLVGLSMPLPAPAGQRMGPWIKVDVSVKVPCHSDEENIRTASQFCQSFAESRVEEILKNNLRK